MPKIAIKPATLAALKAQYISELSNVNYYLALSLWSEKENLNGFAGWFKKQSAEETLHAAKIAEHLIDRGELPEVGAIPAAKIDFASLIEVAKYTQTIEGATTDKIYAAYQTAVQEGDLPAQLFLQWYVNEQVEEEAWTDEMVDRVSGATCAGSLGELDRHIERYLGGE